MRVALFLLLEISKEHNKKMLGDNFLNCFNAVDILDREFGNELPVLSSPAKIIISQMGIEGIFWSLKAIGDKYWGERAWGLASRAMRCISAKIDPFVGDWEARAERVERIIFY